MATVADILKYVETIAPPYMAEGWDNCGLLCGRKDREVKKILVALDPFATVIDEAIALGVDLIVTHHPLIFRDKLMAVNEDTEAGRCVLKLIENGVAAINAHTNLDMAPGGVNEVLAKTLGLADIEIVDPVENYGLLRKGNVAEQPLEDFLGVVKSSLKCKGLRYVSSGKPVTTVAVGGGSCADFMQAALAAGCDTFVTADVKYNQFRTAYELGLNLIDAGHFHTENPVMPVVAAGLREKFPQVEVIFSENHTDAMNFFV